MRKIDCQPTDSVSSPPTSGPTPTAAPVVAPHTPNAVPRSRPWNVAASNASDVANIRRADALQRPRELEEQRRGGEARRAATPP
jgi:hypothetical protein